MATDADRIELKTGGNAIADDQLENVTGGAATGFDCPAGSLVVTVENDDAKVPDVGGVAGFNEGNAVGGVHLSHIKKYTS